MISLAALFLFGWFFFKSVGLAFRVAWCAAKTAAAVLFVVALPLMVVGLLIGGIIKLALPLLLITPPRSVAEKLRITAQKIPLCSRKWHTRRYFCLYCIKF